MRKYKSVQTGPKSQLGGEKKGLLRVAYQVGMAEIVKGVPRNPTNSQPTMEIISLGKFFICLQYGVNSIRGQSIL